MFLSPLQLVIVGLYAAIIGLIVVVFFTDVDEESWKGAIARFTVETVRGSMGAFGRVWGRRQLWARCNVATG